MKRGAGEKGFMERGSRERERLGKGRGRRQIE